LISLPVNDQAKREEMLSYNNLCTLFYEADDKQFPAGALDYYRRLLEEADGPILEAMSGSGRFLIPFAKDGFDIDGVDASPFMLAAARAKCDAAGLSPVMIEAKLDEMSLARKYKLIICVARSISLVADREEFCRIMANLRDHLVPGGRLVMEFVTPGGAIRKNNVAFSRWAELDEVRRILLSIVIEYDSKLQTSRMLNKYEFFEGAKLIETELEVIDQRYWEIEDLATVVMELDFVDVRILKPYGDRPAMPGDPDVVLDCRSRS
jgi:SAM-dependent methyltransferase